MSSRQPRLIRKRIWPKCFQAVKDGLKTAELRLADFEAKVGDFLVLEEWVPETGDYTGDSIVKRISHNVKLGLTEFHILEELEEHGLYLMSMKPITSKLERNIKFCAGCPTQQPDYELVDGKRCPCPRGRRDFYKCTWRMIFVESGQWIR